MSQKPSLMQSAQFVRLVLKGNTSIDQILLDWQYHGLQDNCAAATAPAR